MLADTGRIFHNTSPLFSQPSMPTPAAPSAPVLVKLTPSPRTDSPVYVPQSNSEQNLQTANSSTNALRILSRVAQVSPATLPPLRLGFWFSSQGYQPIQQITACRDITRSLSAGPPPAQSPRQPPTRPSAQVIMLDVIKPTPGLLCSCKPDVLWRWLGCVGLNVGSKTISSILLHTLLGSSYRWL